jgi:hypothetical protein
MPLIRKRLHHSVGRKVQNLFILLGDVEITQKAVTGGVLQFKVQTP